MGDCYLVWPSLWLLAVLSCFFCNADGFHSSERICEAIPVTRGRRRGIAPRRSAAEFPQRRRLQAETAYRVWFHCWRALPACLDHFKSLLSGLDAGEIDY